MLNDCEYFCRMFTNIDSVLVAVNCVHEMIDCNIGTVLHIVREMPGNFMVPGQWCIYGTVKMVLDV